MMPVLHHWLIAGKTVVMPGGSCVKADGSFDITKVCSTAAPVCQTPPAGRGTCVTAGTPAPCNSFGNLGDYCDEKQGKCCAGGPKNAKCTNNKCVTTYPTPTPAPAPAYCTAKLGEYCDDKKCCAGGPKNAKCTNNKCVTTYPTPAKAPAPATKSTPTVTEKGQSLLKWTADCLYALPYDACCLDLGATAQLGRGLS
jgi:hypothetical protein